MSEGYPWTEHTKEEKLANKIMAVIQDLDWSNGGVDAWSATVALSMVQRHITEYYDPADDMRS